MSPIVFLESSTLLRFKHSSLQSFSKFEGGKPSNSGLFSFLIRSVAEGSVFKSS
jgi:hypothetical protein